MSDGDGGRDGVLLWHMGSMGPVRDCTRVDDHPVVVCGQVAECTVCRQGAGNDCQHFVAR